MFFLQAWRWSKGKGTKEAGRRGKVGVDFLMPTGNRQLEHSQHSYVFSFVQVTTLGLWWSKLQLLRWGLHQPATVDHGGRQNESLLQVSYVFSQNLLQFKRPSSLWVQKVLMKTHGITKLFLVTGWKHHLLQFWLLSTWTRSYFFMWSNKLFLFGGLNLTLENDMYLSREKDFSM